MKKILVSLLTLTILAAPVLVAAQPTTAPTLDVWDSLDQIVNWIFAILLVVAVIFILIAAFQFITAAGDADKVKTARNFVLYALIGVAVAFLAKGLIVFVQTIVT